MKYPAAAFGALALAGAAMVADGQTSRPAPAVDPIAFTGHGAIFGPDGNEVSATADFIQSAQQVYLTGLVVSASPNQRVQIDQRRKRIAELTRGNPRAAIDASAMLLDWALSEVRPANAALLASRLRVLAMAIRSLPATDRLSSRSGMPPGAGLSDHALAMLAQDGLGTAAAVPEAATVGEERDAYITRCGLAGVPIPPDWGKNGAGKWQSKGKLASPFISRTLDAEVFFYESAAPEGVCFALPRYGKAAGADIELLGIVCMGSKSVADGAAAARSNACFWDNQRAKKAFLIKQGIEVPLKDFASGNELAGGSGGECSSCHAGENSFVIHPRDPAFKPLLSKLSPATFYRPLVDASWFQNPVPTVDILDRVPLDMVKNKACNGCHSDGGEGGRLPVLSTALRAYCAAVLRNAINLTMPPGKAGDKPHPSYEPHTKVLLAACNKAP